MEEFIPLKSLNNQFGINKKAQVIRFSTGKIIKSYIGVDDYEHIILNIDGKKKRKRVHRLMAEAFLHNCKYVDHIDSNKSNNNLNNLRPITVSENNRKAFTEYTYINPHKGRGIWVKAINKKTHKEIHCKSMREIEKKTGVDRHRIKQFLERNNAKNYYDWLFYYDE